MSCCAAYGQNTYGYILFRCQSTPMTNDQQAFTDIFNLMDGDKRANACRQYGAPNILAYIEAARVERVARPRAKDGAHKTTQGRNIERVIEDGLRALVHIHAQVQDIERARAREARGGGEDESRSDDEPPPLEPIPGQYAEAEPGRGSEALSGLNCTFVPNKTSIPTHLVPSSR